MDKNIQKFIKYKRYLTSLRCSEGNKWNKYQITAPKQNTPRLTFTLLTKKIREKSGMQQKSKMALSSKTL